MKVNDLRENQCAHNRSKSNDKKTLGSTRQRAQASNLRSETTDQNPTIKGRREARDNVRKPQTRDLKQQIKIQRQKDVAKHETTCAGLKPAI